ncbi:MAG: DUF1343 domain-containing protein [Verrucomicrobia bacterium]|nr:DUF1343 domain-containing protein [Verrucomicrobiota bacterium]
MMRARIAVLLVLWLLPLVVAGQIQLGDEVLAADGCRELQGKRVGLLTNPSGVNHQLESTIDVLRRAPGVRLVALFAAEHGLSGDVPAGVEFPNRLDSRTGLPVFSLYGPGPTRAPTPAMLRNVDAVVYDIQDTGCRSYTFITTLGLTMAACAAANVEFVVLDRPDPLGGERVEGPTLDPRFRSMVGQWEVPYIYGLTCGELARMINGEHWISKPCRLTVVPLKHWERGMVWRATGLPWVAPSPNIPQDDSPLFYAATGLLGELGGLNIGIGSPWPFQVVGAPWLDADQFSRGMNQVGLYGVRFRPVTFRPFNSVYPMRGAQIYFTDRARAPLLAISFYLMDAVRKLTGRNLYLEALAARKSFAMFDKVTGSDATRQALAAGRSAAAIVNSWKAGEAAFRQQRQKYLLY